MFHLFRHRIHESVALSAVLAAGVALHAAWIGHLLALRLSSVAEFFTFNQSLAVGTGLLIFVAACYLLVFFAAGLWFRGRDCSDFRNQAFWFFIVAIVLFVLLTLPSVYGFEIAAVGL